MNSITKLAGIMVVAGAMSSAYSASIFVGTQDAPAFEVQSTGAGAQLGDGADAGIVNITGVDQDLDTDVKVNHNLILEVGSELNAPAASFTNNPAGGAGTTITLKDSSKIQAVLIVNPTGKTIAFPMADPTAPNMPIIDGDIDNDGTISGYGYVTGTVTTIGKLNDAGANRVLEFPGTIGLNIKKSDTEDLVTDYALDAAEKAKIDTDGDVLKATTDAGTVLSRNVDLSTDKTVTNLPTLALQTCTGKTGYSGTLLSTEANKIPVKFDAINEATFELTGDNSLFTPKVQFVPTVDGASTLKLGTNGKLPGGLTEIGTDLLKMHLQISEDAVLNAVTGVSGDVTIDAGKKLTAGANLTIGGALKM